RLKDQPWVSSEPPWRRVKKRIAAVERIERARAIRDFTDQKLLHTSCQRRSSSATTAIAVPMIPPAVGSQNVNIHFKVVFWDRVISIERSRRSSARRCSSFASKAAKRPSHRPFISASFPSKRLKFDSFRSRKSPRDVVYTLLSISTSSLVTSSPNIS